MNETFFGDNFDGKWSKKMQIVAFINCPFYNVGAKLYRCQIVWCQIVCPYYDGTKLSEAKFSGYQIVLTPDDIDDDHAEDELWWL